MTATLTLTDAQPIRLAAWGKMTYATVFGLRGYCERNGSDYAKALERAERLGHEVVGSCYAGATLTDSKSFYEKQEAIVASAVTLEHGQLVEIEGATYQVVVLKGNERSPIYSNPIAFRRA